MAVAYESYVAEIDALVRAGQLGATEAQAYKEAYAREHPETTTAGRQAAFQSTGGLPALNQALTASYANGGGGPVNQGLAQVQAQAGYNNQRLAQGNALNARYGNDMAWLDPTFQYQPAMLGQSYAAQAYADPQAIQAQYGALGNMQSLYSQPMQWMSGQQQQDMYNRLLSVQAPVWDSQAMGRQNQAYGMIQGIQGPAFESAARQEDVYNQARARARGEGAPEFLGDQDQRQVYDALGSIAQSGGAQGITYDPGTRQATQYGNLEEIIAGGGANAIEMANRQTQRADQEQWLRSQREATQQQMAARGLTGSGQELLGLSAAQQASAGRNSLADLQTAAQLEARRMQAIESAAGVAGTMRGQTMAEQQFNAARGDQALAGQGQMANALRQGDYLEKSYLDQSMLQALGLSAQEADQLRQARYAEEMGRTGFQLNQANSMGNLASTMRGQTFNEQSYQNQAAQNQAIAAANIASTMRGQTFNENSFTRNNQTQLLDMQGRLASGIRDSSFQEAYNRGSSQDQFSIMNQQAINSAAQTNTAFLQNAWQNTINQRNAWDRQTRQMNAEGAAGVMSSDARNAQFDTNTYNELAGQYRSDLMGTYGGYVPQAGGFKDTGDALMIALQAYLGGMGGGMGAAAGQGASAAGSSGGDTSSVPNYGTGGGGGNVGLPKYQALGSTGYNPQQPGVYDPNKKVY